MKLFVIRDSRRPSNPPMFAATKTVANEHARKLSGLESNRKSKHITIATVETEAKGRGALVALVNQVLSAGNVASIAA